MTQKVIWVFYLRVISGIFITLKDDEYYFVILQTLILVAKFILENYLSFFSSLYSIINMKLVHESKNAIVYVFQSRLSYLELV